MMASGTFMLARREVTVIPVDFGGGRLRQDGERCGGAQRGGTKAATDGGPTPETISLIGKGRGQDRGVNFRTSR